MHSDGFSAHEFTCLIAKLWVGFTNEHEYIAPRPPLFELWRACGGGLSHTETQRHKDIKCEHIRVAHL